MGLAGKCPHEMKALFANIIELKLEIFQPRLAAGGYQWIVKVTTINIYTYDIYILFYNIYMYTYASHSRAIFTNNVREQNAIGGFAQKKHGWTVLWIFQVCRVGFRWWTSSVSHMNHLVTSAEKSYKNIHETMFMGWTSANNFVFFCLHC